MRAEAVVANDSVSSPKAPSLEGVVAEASKYLTDIKAEKSAFRASKLFAEGVTRISSEARELKQPSRVLQSFILNALGEIVSLRNRLAGVSDTAVERNFLNALYNDRRGTNPTDEGLAHVVAAVNEVLLGRLTLVQLASDPVFISVSGAGIVSHNDAKAIQQGLGNSGDADKLEPVSAIHQADAWQAAISRTKPNSRARKQLAESDGVHAMLEGEQLDIATELVYCLRTHDWFYSYADDHRAWRRGSDEANKIRSLMQRLPKDVATNLYDKYSPHAKT